MPQPALLEKLESDRALQQQRDKLTAQCAAQIHDLHSLFVQWFRGTRPLSELERELKQRLTAQFSHVAPNGQFLAGRQVLLGHLKDKYGCYKDRVFEIDIYNVQVIWTSSTPPQQCLVTYEEWQSWQRDDEDHTDTTGGSNNNNNNNTQQFGRLSTCLLQQNEPAYRWIHVHETWLEEEAPSLTAKRAEDLASSSGTLDNDTIITGPVLPPGKASLHLPATAGTGSLYAQSRNRNDDSETEDGAAATTTLLVLQSTQSMASSQIHQDTAVRILQNLSVPYDVVDGAQDRARRNELFGISQKRGLYPQFFLVKENSDDSNDNETTTTTTTYWGNFDKLQTAHSAGTLVQDLQAAGVAASTNPFHEEPQKKEEEISSNPHEEDSDEESAMGAATAKAAAAMTGGALLAGLLAESQNNKNNNRPKPDLNGSFSNAAPGWAMSASEHTEQRSATTSDSNNGDSFGQEGSGDVLFFEPDAQAKADKRREEEEEREEQEEEDLKKKKDQKTADTIQTEDDLEPEEQAFLEASKGILEFEDEESDHTQEMELSNSAEEDEQGELPIAAEQTQTSIPNDISNKRHVSPKLEKYAKPMMWEGALVGISVAGFDIGSSQGPMADESWYKENGARLEEMAQSVSIPKPRRRLCLPEMVFPVAHVALEGNGIWLSWDASDALESWAQCHKMIAVLSRIGWHGVNVIRSSDAGKWEGKRKHICHEEAAAAVFHYDWTYSTPYCGTVQGGVWNELDESGMRMELLTDQSVPILFFDEIVLYEDDLHDNGQCQYSVKLRVMPTCAYILARLWVRVDNIILRIRETRILVDLFGIKPQIYRDVTWRECAWDKLKEHNLPDDVRSWQHNGPEDAAWHAQLQKIPEVDPPKDVVMKYAVLEYSGKPSGAVEL